MKRSPTPPPLVMIPGHLLTSELWKQQEQHLTPHYPCILPEIPEAETIREMASMILDQIPESFFLAGLSMGGMIALEILNIASERVLKLALLDTTAGPETMERSRQRTEFLEDAERQGFENTIEQRWIDLMLTEEGRKQEELPKAIMRMASKVGLERCRQQVRALMARQDNRKILASISCPTLVVCGEEDMLTPPEIHREMAENIPNARLELIPGCGHLTPLEAPDRLNELMLEWLEKP